MNTGILVRLMLCILTIGIFLYAYISKQNSITELRLEIPRQAKALEVITQENNRFQFEIDQFESPLRLMELASQPQFSHLKHPLLKDIITLPAAPEEK